jgi:hypothetical protein
VKTYRPINSIDSKTKHSIATTFTQHRTKEKCREHFKKLYDKIGEQVKDKLYKPPDFIASFISLSDTLSRT